MNRTNWLIAFGIVLAGDLVAIQLAEPILHYICKPLIVPALIGYFLAASSDNTLRKWILAALLFSWIGDVLLMFDDRNELYFLLGLSSFLIAHLFYIVFFHNIRVREQVGSKPWLLLPVLAYYVGLITLLSPYLGDKRIPVRVYGIVISFMLLVALHMFYIKNKPAAYRMIIGAILFVISDSVLAINKFYHPFEGAGIIVMLTYGLAQFFIVDGASRYTKALN
jgi:uncharacterized membrane protein YhhN